MTIYRSLNPADFPLPEWHPYMIGSVVPRPIAWVTTVDQSGRPNLAPFSYFNVFSSKPPVAAFSPSTSARTGKPKDTHQNLLEVPECVIHLVPYALAARMNITTGEYERGIDEIERAGLDTIPSEVVRPPRIVGTPVQMEAKLRQIISLGDNPGAGQLILVEIVRLHLAEHILNDKGHPDPRKMDVIARLGGFWYMRLVPESLFWMKQPRNPAEVMAWHELPRDIRESKVLSAAEIGHLLAFRPPDAERLASLPEPSDPEALHRKMQSLLPDKAEEAWRMYIEHVQSGI
ncbi:MAG: flavin reductase family protein [Bacteroidia bacterium]|nr:flavin reductase family protein [Bacteroidia bacterium]MCX7652939.1 flavin reductase family protein [Bacteroidia bacterium]MDW8416593.1 flavin reductase family protein [Bacteroidia bacterium]